MMTVQLLKNQNSSLHNLQTQQSATVIPNCCLACRNERVISKP